MTENNLEDRVEDIEKTIGDTDQVLEALKDCLAQFIPTCPPYCAHGVEPEYEDERSLEVQVAEMARVIGDLAAVFACLTEILANRPIPTCPPYCAH